MDRIRKFGQWIHDWPCNHGYHTWSLWRPGRNMWTRQCEHCRAPEMTVQPKIRAECDIEFYKNVYLPRMEKVNKAL